ncbi:hypothetical protein ACVIW2_004677 [Bradyrhizobium huanghuaihaiense]|nr:hypothetical protein [Bradyrhizobium huanghuaihaiense]
MAAIGFAVTSVSRYSQQVGHARFRQWLSGVRRSPAAERRGLPGGNAMEFLWSVVTFIGQAVEAIFGYVEHHHWIFAFLAGGYVFYLHDRSVHARFDALDKRVDEIRKRLAIEY